MAIHSRRFRTIFPKRREYLSNSKYKEKKMISLQKHHEQVMHRLRADILNLEAEISRLEADIESAPAGTLKISKKHGYTEYYQRFSNRPDGTEHKIYIRKENMELARLLAQKDYNRAVLKILKARLQKLTRISADFPGGYIDSIYENLPQERKQLVVPIIASDEQFIAEWQNRPYKSLEFRPDDAGSYYTERGERVRSKSEVIIANTLYHTGIPYKYECPLIFTDRTLYPDFTILNIRTRKEIIFEHFGILDDPDYLTMFQKKLEFYAFHGLLPGRGLIYTLESSQHPLDTRMLKKIFDTYLK